MSFEHIGEPVHRLLQNIAKQQREIIRDEAHAHAIIEPILERQQIDAASIEAIERVRENADPRAWDNLSDRDMTWWR